MQEEGMMVGIFNKKNPELIKENIVEKAPEMVQTFLFLFTPASLFLKSVGFLILSYVIIQGDMRQKSSTFSTLVTFCGRKYFST